MSVSEDTDIAPQPDSNTNTNLDRVDDAKMADNIDIVRNIKMEIDPFIESTPDSQTDIPCPNCNRKFVSVDGLQTHIYECHPGLLQEDDDVVALDDPNQKDVTRKTYKKNLKCRHCPFIAKNKLEFWQHGTIHLKPEKKLTCPKCSFATEYKHHLEYHLRNHFGSKPFKCEQCSYSCVNKSMLNSHMKSHSTVYQYRCLDCSYATKYCHSLKLHLRKYSHKPAVVLNPDGTPNPFPIIDVYGTRRGPRPKKLKPNTPVTSSPQMPHDTVVSTTMTHLLPALYYSPPSFGGSSPVTKTVDNLEDKNALGGMVRCNNCDFHTTDREKFSQHMIQHIQLEEKQNELNPEDCAKDVSSISSPPKLTSTVTQGFTPLDLSTDPKITPLKNGFQPHGFGQAPRQRRPSYGDSNGGTDRDTSSSTSSMSPDDANPGMKSPPPLHPLNREYHQILETPRHNAVPNVFWQHEYLYNGLRNSIENRQNFLGHHKGSDEQLYTLKTKIKPKPRWKEIHTCSYCNIAFENYIMYTMHMGYHGYTNPFKCNICGHQSEDKVSFFLHIARMAHL